ncbi:MAG: type I glutamate--ammonia ligase [Candidatus Thermoplasmatota archaeon]|jgi:glutamine synthetase|nr:type I glutamate--ammonia ligase [Candidatus Thermoplasmatota archaeon]MCL5791069.1 type I glutamate--ammonia ligase [Candidatus Thermoplasmatota archaeon]
MEDKIQVSLERLRKEQIDFLHMQFTDIQGIVKTVTLPKNRFEDALNEGVVFDGSSVAGYAQIEESDMRAVPDLDTYAVYPYSSQGNAARYICNIYSPDGTRFEGDPRYVLERNLKKVWEKNMEFFVGPEFEFFIFKRDSNGNPVNEPGDYGGYFDHTPNDQASQIRQEILTYLRLLGYEPEAAHHEVAWGQQEIDLRYAAAMTMADRITVLKSVIKNAAENHGLFASFMPKPINGVNGSGMHIHQSIMARDQKKNYFYDETNPYGLSEMARQYTAGILKYINEGSSVLASWVNSYKRLIPGYEAPVYISWANRNRTALVRIPAGKNMRKRIELRCPDPAGNPYLQFATVLGMGLKGIEEKLELPEPAERDIFHMTGEERIKNGIYSMPESLGEALHHLRSSSVMREILGEHVYNNFITVKQREWDDFRSRVTGWEVERYLNIL